MTESEYRKTMYSLGCTDKDVQSSLKLVGWFVRRNPWINVDDLLTLGLECVPRARETYVTNRQAAFTTHLMTITRNACLSHVNREEKQRERATSLGSRTFGSDCNFGLVVEVDPQDSASHREVLQVLADVLSPYAWRLIRLIEDSLPKRVTMKEVGRVLGLSPVSVSHVYTEVREVISEVIVSAPLGERKRKGTDRF